MDGKHPTTIFSDQAQAMARVIDVALPYTRHSQCHISKEVSSKVLCFNRNSIVRGLFYKCLSKYDLEEKFKEACLEKISIRSLKNHAWLEELYKIRSK